MKNKMNPTTKKSSKQGTQIIPVQRMQSSKNQAIDIEKLKDLNVEQPNRDIKSNKNLNLIKKSLNNNLNPQKKNITNTESKNHIKKSSNSNTLLYKVKYEKNKKIFSDMKAKDNTKREGKKFKNSDKIINENLFPESRKNIHNNNKKHNVSETGSIKEMDSISDVSDESIEDTNQHHNVNIKSEIDLHLKQKNNNNNKNNIKKWKIGLNSTKYVNHLISLKNQNQMNRNKNDIKSTKTVVPKKIKEDIKDNLIDLLLSDNEFGEPQTNELKETKCIKLSTNPFMSEMEERSSNCNTENNMNISELKKNLDKNISYNLNIPAFVHHIKSSTFNLRKSKSPTTNPNSASSNILSIQNSKKTLNTNTESSDNPNLDHFYRKLLILAKRGDRQQFLETFRQILSIQKKININYKDENGFTALHFACDEGNLKIVEIILGAGCDTNIKNIYKQTPLHISAKRGYFDISKKLIESGAELNIEDSEKNTPLHYVCKDNYIELLKYFLTKNPKVDIKNIYGKTPKDLTTDAEIKNLLDEYIKNNKINPYSARYNEDHHQDMKRINILDKKDLIKLPRKTKLEMEINTLANSLNISSDKNNLSPINTNKNCILKKEHQVKENRKKEISHENSLINIHKEKKDPNIFFQSTNNINNNNNNININIYSINGSKRTRTNTNISSSHCIRKNNYSMRDYINIDDSYHYNIMNTSLNKLTNSNSNSGPFYKIKTHDRKNFNTLQSKFNCRLKLYQNDSKSILDSIDSSDNNIFNLSKNQEKIILNSKMKNENINIYDIHGNQISSTNKIKNFPNSSKHVQSTQQLFTKRNPNQKKKTHKLDSSKNIDDSILKNIKNIHFSKIAALKPHKILSNLDLINRSNILSSKTRKKFLNTTQPSIEHISPSNFICLAQLGKGSFGEVYLVQKIDSSEKYAMKVLRKERIMSQNLLKYALAERNVLSLSNHPFIVKLDYAFQTATKLYFVMEYCPNGDLAKHLLFEKRFKEPRAKFYICEVILALENLHKRDVIFRDLKPDNVILDEEGHCKLTDFGLSKEGVNENAYAKSFCGSVAYLAPEMLKKQGHGKAVDWYLLGVLFYEMLVGMTPYFTTRKEDLFYNIENAELKIPNFVSKEAADLLRKLLERNPNKRLGGCGRDADEIKEHPYFKDVDWKKVYEKKLKVPNFVNYVKKTTKFYAKPKLFASDDFVNRTEDQNMPDLLKGWSFINKDEIME